MKFFVEYTNKQERREEFKDVEEAFEFFENMRLKADVAEATLLDENDEVIEAYVR